MSDGNVSLPDPIPPAPYVPSATVARHGDGFWGKEGLSFANLLDVVNPLQHIPVVGSIYRAVTGDQISPGARIAGGTLFGGPIGFAAAVANLVVEDAAGIDIGKSAVAMVSGKKDEAVVPAPQLASAAIEATPATTAALPATVAPGAMAAAPGAIATASGPALLQPAKMVVAPQGAAPAATHAPSPWSALAAPAQLMPPSATQGHLATATTAGVVSPAQKDALFARLAGQAPSLPAGAAPNPAEMLDAQKKDALFARLAGTTSPDPASTDQAAADTWRSTQRPKLTAPIRPKVRGPFAANVPANTQKLQTPAVTADAQTLSATPAAAPAAPAATSTAAKLPGGYTAQELLQMYQRYQKPGAAPAVSASADSNS